MKLTLIEGASKRWHKYWSMRLLIVSIIGQVLVDFVPYLEDFIPRGTFIVLSIAAGVARVVKQEWGDDTSTTQKEG